MQQDDDLINLRFCFRVHIFVQPTVSRVANRYVVDFVDFMNQLMFLTNLFLLLDLIYLIFHAVNFSFLHTEQHSLLIYICLEHYG